MTHNPQECPCGSGYTAGECENSVCEFQLRFCYSPGFECENVVRVEGELCPTHSTEGPTA